jgi:5-aminolevulinate synthase
MSQHPGVMMAMTENSVQDGNGAGGTCKIAGTNSPLLGRELADLHGKAAELVFTSDSVSNQSEISIIARPVPCLTRSTTIRSVSGSRA